MSRKHRIVVGSILLALVLVASTAVGCGPKEPDAVTWRLHTISAEGEKEVDYMQHIVDEVKAQTGGRFIIEIFPGGALGYSEEDVLRVMSQDAVEIAHSFNSRVAGDEPLATVSEIPFLATKPADVEALNRAVKPMWDEILADWNGMLLSNWSSYLAPLTATREVATVEDWQDLKIRTQSATMSTVIELMGAVPVSVPFSEAYSASATGIVEGHFWSPGTIFSMKMFELCDYMNYWSAMAFGSGLIVNTTAFNQLPEDYQNALLNAAEKWEPWIWETEFWSAEEDIAELEATGQIEMVQVSDQEKIKAAEMISPVYDEWLKNAGPDGLKWLNVMLATVGKAAYQ